MATQEIARGLRITRPQYGNMRNNQGLRITRPWYGDISAWGPGSVHHTAAGRRRRRCDTGSEACASHDLYMPVSISVCASRGRKGVGTQRRSCDYGLQSARHSTFAANRALELECSNPSSQDSRIRCLHFSPGSRGDFRLGWVGHPAQGPRRSAERAPPHPTNPSQCVG